MAGQENSGSRPGFMGSRENDMFAGVRGDSSEGPLMGPALAAVVCLVCFGCVFIGLIIAFFVWAVVTLFDSASSSDTDCGKNHLVWQYCVTTVVIMPVLGLCVNLLTSATRMVYLAFIPSLISLGIAIWGIEVWAHLGECDLYYYHQYPDLLLLFKIYVVLFSLSFGLFICGLCLVVLTAGSLLDAAGSSSDGKPGGGGYSSYNGGSDSQDEALRRAARDGSYAEVERLISGDKSLNVNARDPSNGWTALHYAAYYNQRRIAEFLVASGARLDEETFDQKTPLTLAQEQNNDVAQFLEGLGAHSYNAPGGRPGPAATMEFV